jgi:hypothetical protein
MSAQTPSSLQENNGGNSSAGKDSGLDFIDLLYAVPIAVLATQIARTNPAHIQAAGWADVGVALFAITFGWLGHHANRGRVPPKARKESNENPFTTLRFPQLIVEILVIGMYFAIVTRVALPHQPGASLPSARSKAVLLTILFGVYLIWDLFEICITERSVELDSTWPRRARRGACVTCSFILVFALLLFIAYEAHAHRAHVVIAFDVVSIVCLYAYRLIQHDLGGGASKNSTGTLCSKRRRAVATAGVVAACLVALCIFLETSAGAKEPPGHKHHPNCGRQQERLKRREERTGRAASEAQRQRLERCKSEHDPSEVAA